MTKHFALIACSNGFGHARRTLALALELLQRGHNVTWFGQAEAFAHFKFHFDFLDQQNGKLTVLPLVTNKSAAALRQAPSDAMNWYRQLPSLASYDGVLSDNLLENLKFYNSLDASDRNSSFRQDFGSDMQTKEQLLHLVEQAGDTTYKAELEKKFAAYKLDPSMLR